MLLALTLAFAQQGLPELVLREDNLRISRSCVVRIPSGLVVADSDHNGVIHVEGDDIEIYFAPGSVLRGAPLGTPLDELTGTGVVIDHSRDVTLRGLRVEGFHCGLRAREADGLSLRQAEFANNFAQRLRSTPQAEDGSDWLWPHRNDEKQWLENYGAAVYVESSEDIELADIVVRRQQNGILLDRVSHSRIYDNDCSFLSGWGLGLWRSSDNLVSRNAFDFCVRGYSHGVYNRGQDSAGILLFEQSNRNQFLLNSATHGGDGVFGFAGREAIGEADVPATFSHAGVGCNENVFVGNDFSYAVAHGLELTFSFNNRILRNRFVGNGICGIWGGFSQGSWIQDNHFEANGDMGYGLERGAINIDRSRGTLIIDNDFVANKADIHLWSLPTSFEEKPWGQQNKLSARGNRVEHNRFSGSATALHLRGDVAVSLASNRGWQTCAEDYRLEGATRLSWRRDAPEPSLGLMRSADFGRRTPVGARSGLAGRENIIMTEWGPWDHRSVLVHQVASEAGRHLYRIEPPGTVAELIASRPRKVGRIYGESGSGYLEVRAPDSAWFDYVIDLDVGGARRTVRGSMLRADWEVTCFPSVVDPREDLAAWQEQANSDAAVTTEMSELTLAYGSSGPGSVNAGFSALQATEHFGTRARTIVELPAGSWKVETLSDDGIRVRVDGELVIDNWTWHAPTRDEGTFQLNTARRVAIEVEHFELDGYAVLEFALSRADS